MSVFSAVLCLPAAQEGGWEGGYRGRRLQQEPEPREQHGVQTTHPTSGQQKWFITFHWSTSASLQAVSQGHAVPGLCHPKLLSGSLKGISPAKSSLGAAHTPSYWDGHLPWLKGIYPLVFCLCQRKSACQGASSRYWSRACGDGTFSCHELIFFPMPEARLQASLSLSSIPGPALRSGLCSCMQGRQHPMCSPVAWSAGRRDAAELATPGWCAWWWQSL